MDAAEAMDKETAAKYRVAAYVFLVLNLIYAVLGWLFMPPFAEGIPKEVVWIAVIVMVLLLFPVIRKGSRRWVRVLAVIFFIRSVGTGYVLATQETLPVVPFLFPCLVFTFYFLGRAGWDWP